MSKRLRYGFLRQELTTIFNWLAPQVTLRNKRWLDREIPGLWKGKQIIDAINDIRKRDMSFLRLSIEGILDAKKEEKASFRRPVTTLAIEDLLQLAALLKIELPDEISAPDLRDLIINKIEIGD